MGPRESYLKTLVPLGKSLIFSYLGNGSFLIDAAKNMRKKQKTKQKIIKPKVLKGFRDFLPEDMRLREYVINTFKRVFERYGYEPLETPALEYSRLMLGISGEEAEKQFFRFRDQGGRDVMLRFEVMVPMCHVIAQYKDKIFFL